MLSFWHLLSAQQQGLSPPSHCHHPPQHHGHHPLPQQGPQDAGVVKAGAGAHAGTPPRGLFPPCTAAPCSPKVLPQVQLISAWARLNFYNCPHPPEGAPLTSVDWGEPENVGKVRERRHSMMAGWGAGSQVGPGSVRSWGPCPAPLLRLAVGSCFQSRALPSKAGT